MAVVRNHVVAGRVVGHDRCLLCSIQAYCMVKFLKFK